jgi:hypothetical protein
MLPLKAVQFQGLSSGATPGISILVVRHEVSKNVNDDVELRALAKIESMDSLTSPPARFLLRDTITGGESEAVPTTSSLCRCRVLLLFLRSIWSSLENNKQRGPTRVDQLISDIATGRGETLSCHGSVTDLVKKAK